MSRPAVRLIGRARPVVPFARTGPRARYTSASSSASSSSPPKISTPRALLAGVLFGVAAGGIYLPTRRSSAATGKIPYAEVQRHNTPEDCWVVIGDKVYDLTAFAPVHPGGTAPIYKVAGHDATAIFETLHSPGIIEDRLDPSACVGDVDTSTLPPRPVVADVIADNNDESERPIDLAEVVGIPDFDEAARRNMSSKAWAYISAGATDMASVDMNRRAWNAVLFRPRVLVDVGNVDTSTSMLGHATSLPVFVCPTGMSKLAGPEGEPGIAAAAGECDVIQMVSTNSSAPLEATVEARSRPDQVQFMQLYVDRIRPNSVALLERVNNLGMGAVFVTVDCAAPGKREADERNRASVEVASGISGGTVKSDKRGGGVGRTTGAFIDPALSWDDIAWIRENTKLPLGVKGIQCVEDAVRAADAGVDAIYLSNHGGRALDTSPPALYTLLELRRLRPDVFDRCEVYVDGGVRRGSDVVKALCLGAKGVGMGRPFLYALTYGKEGVTHAIDIMRDEIETTMRLLGVTRLDQLGPHLLNTRALDSQVIDALEYGPKETHLPKGRK